MPGIEVKTRVDVIDHLTDWVGTSSIDPLTLRKMHRAIEAAYRELPAARKWSYYYARGRLNTVADYSTGTITYTNSTREVTLASGTWPSWARYGIIQIDSVEYEVASRTSDSVIILSYNSNPGEDIAAGETYVLYRDEYPLPVLFQSLGAIRDAENGTFLQRIEANDLTAMRSPGTVASSPVYYTIMRDSNYVGAVGLRLHPPPDDIYKYDYVFHRRPRQFTCYQYNTGTVTTSGTTLTGSGTTFLSSMVGCLIRFGSTSTLPTGTHGTNPFVANRIIAAYTGGTGLTLDQALDSELTAVKYEISDPIDIESGAMYTAFLRRVEYELGLMQNKQNIRELKKMAEDALVLACENDNRSFDRNPDGNAMFMRVPSTFDITNYTP